MPNEGKYNILSLSPGNENVVTIDGISHAIPVDLFDGDNNLMPLPYYARGIQENGTSELCRKSKNASGNLTWFKAEPNDYGQLKSILAANNGNEIDSLVVVGPMNKDDFKASAKS